MTVAELYERMEGDYQAALRVMMADSMIGRMIRMFPADGSCGKLLSAGEAMDAAGLFESAHALKGLSGSLGLMKMSSMASEMCEEFRPGRERKMTDGEVRERLDSIRALYEKIVGAIREFEAQ